MNRADVIELIEGYFGKEKVKECARIEAESTINRLLEHGMKGRVAAILEAKPSETLDQLFRSSGMVVKTDASKVFDEIVSSVLNDETSGVPEAIRQYTKDNIVELIQRSVTEVVVNMVVTHLKSNASTLAAENLISISQAFNNARMQLRG